MFTSIFCDVTIPKNKIDQIRGSSQERMAATNLFKDVPLIPTDHVFHVNACYQKDTSPNKVNLGIGGKQ
jgi:hypothetical protein